LGGVQVDAKANAVDGDSIYAVTYEAAKMDFYKFMYVFDDNQEAGAKMLFDDIVSDSATKNFIMLAPPGTGKTGIFLMLSTLLQHLTHAQRVAMWPSTVDYNGELLPPCLLTALSTNHTLVCTHFKQLVHQLGNTVVPFKLCWLYCPLQVHSCRWMRRPRSTLP
jgi:hypothetical protein